MKNKNIWKWSSEGISRFDMEKSRKIYFTSKRKLLEMERNLREMSQNRK